MNIEYETSVKNELQLMQDLEDDILLQDCLLGNKIIYGGETQFDEFIKVFNKEMSNDIAAHARRHTNKMHSIK